VADTLSIIVGCITNAGTISDFVGRGQILGEMWDRVLVSVLINVDLLDIPQPSGLCGLGDGYGDAMVSLKLLRTSLF
jgi:hypothetical protein